MPFNYIRDPFEIERRSFEMIRSVLRSHAIPPAMATVAERVVHAAADFSLAELLATGNASPATLTSSLRQGGELFCDVSMLAAGISKKLLAEAGLSTFAPIHDREIVETAQGRGTTRAIAAVEKAVARGIGLFAFGNAPTALFRLLELAEEGAQVDAVIAMPVGLVGAAESKEALLASRIPCLVLRGPRGGSNLCAAAINALLRSSFL